MPAPPTRSVERRVGQLARTGQAVQKGVRRAPASAGPFRARGRALKRPVGGKGIRR